MSDFRNQGSVFLSRYRKKVEYFQIFSQKRSPDKDSLLTSPRSLAILGETFPPTLDTVLRKFGKDKGVEAFREKAMMWFPIVLLALLAPAVKCDRKCGECHPEKCRPPAEDCPTGLVKDLCGCCYVCGRREGELCDADFLPIPYRDRGHGPCGEHLECRPRTDLAPGDPPEAMCVCQKSETLCGSDGRTYDNECQLTEARYKQRDGLRAMHRGPCTGAPKIVSPPEEASNYTGGSIAMSCEATGWPIPVFEWRVDIGDGNTIALPSDDPKVSVQTRGGPSKYEVTSWLQLLSIQPKDEATYWCIAKNDEGESSAAARVVVLDFKGSQTSQKGRSNDL